MSRKLPALLSIVLLLALLFSATAYADSGTALEQDVATTNTYIASAIDRAVALADQALSVCMHKIDVVLHQASVGAVTQDEALSAIAAIEADYQSQIDRIAAVLVDVTDRQAFLLITKSERYDVEIISEYVEVQLGDQTYLIDPLRIVGD